MPANVTPQYRAAEAQLRDAKTIEERKAALEQMLSTIPKHKGTEKMQADLKSRIAKLKVDVKRLKAAFHPEVFATDEALATGASETLLPARSVAVLRRPAGLGGRPRGR